MSSPPPSTPPSPPPSTPPSPSPSPITPTLTSAQLLTLDYPPGRASIASVQNFQILPPPPSLPPSDASDAQSRPAGRSANADSATPNYSASEPPDAAFQAVLVHGLISQTAELDTFSLDLRPPLSPLIAFVAALAAQDWE